MPPETHDPATGMPPVSNDLVTPPASVQNPQPGLLAGICSIVAGVAGFSVPVLGMIASCVGIWLGVKGVWQGRVTKYTPTIICGIIGISLGGLGIVYWVCVILFESYR